MIFNVTFLIVYILLLIVGLRWHNLCRLHLNQPVQHTSWWNWICWETQCILATSVDGRSGHTRPSSALRSPLASSFSLSGSLRTATTRQLVSTSRKKKVIVLWATSTAQAKKNTSALFQVTAFLQPMDILSTICRTCTASW